VKTAKMKNKTNLDYGNCWEQFAWKLTKCFSFWRLCSPAPLPGLHPLTLLGTSVPPDLPTWCPPHWFAPQTPPWC